MVSVVPFTFLVGDSNLTEVVRPTGQSLVTTNSYDAGGFLQTTKDPFGVPTFYLNDALGQPLSVVKGGSYAQAFGNSVITTGYQYNAVGDVTRQTVLNWQPGATAYNDSADLQSQVTIYAYGGIGALDKSLLTGVTYSAGGSESLTYDNLDNTYTRGDRSGNVHQYSYDAAGRQTLDAVTSFGPGVDQTVKAIGTSFDALGDVLSSTSYSNAAGTGIVNQVSHAYNGFAQLMADYENATGAAPTTGSPSVQYAYYESNNDSRLTGEVYPDGRVVAYGYGGSTVDGQISRIDTTSEGTTSGSGTSLVITPTTTEETDNYLGGSMVMGRSLSQINVAEVTSLDGFNRTFDMDWVQSRPGTSGADLDQYQYLYNNDGWVTTRTDAGGTSGTDRRRWTASGTTR